MDKVYINAKYFKDDIITLMFKKDLISVKELIDKIYELNDMLDEIKNELTTVKEELRMKEQELSVAKMGFRPEN